jgi:hypothetical protein
VLEGAAPPARPQTASATDAEATQAMRRVVEIPEMSNGGGGTPEGELYNTAISFKFILDVLDVNRVLL